MKRRLLYILIISCVSFMSYGQTCDEVLDRLIEKLNTTSLQTDFNIAVTEPNTQSLNYSGNLLMLGKKFNLRMLTIQAYYNGKSLWVYDSDIDEINVSNPTEEELQETNPLLLIQLVRRNCRLHYTDNFKDKTQWSVDLYPNNKKSEVLKYTVQFRRTDLMPTRVLISEIQNKTTTVILSGQKFGVATTGHFELDESKHPNATINDLR